MEQQRADLAARVQQARLDRGWSKEEAARNAGISAITWKRIEDGLGVQDGKLAAALRVLELNDQEQPAELPEGARQIGDPSEGLVEFVVEGNFGVRAVVKGPVKDLDALQAAVSRLIAGMESDASNTRAVP